MSGGDAAQQRSLDALIRRQLVVAGVAAAVVLAAIVMVAWAVAQGEADPAVLRPSPDGSQVVTASPVAEPARSATWAVVVALVAVAGVLVLLVDHTVRVARLGRANGRSEQ